MTPRLGIGWLEIRLIFFPNIQLKNLWICGQIWWNCYTYCGAYRLTIRRYFHRERATLAEEINDFLKEEAESERYWEVVAVTNEPLVSSDIIKCGYAAIVDLELTRVDNEKGLSRILNIH